MDPIIIIPLVFLGIGYTFGTINESRHYSSIRKREKLFSTLPAVTVKTVEGSNREIKKAILVQGNAVISIDYFKRFIARLRNIFGGNVRSYESLVDRARREATLRMKKTAGNADIIINIRIETSPIGQSANQQYAVGSVEAIAYGTALTYAPAQDHSFSQD
jgi:uncharacterized protein YbjQ (UPF0145 family)